MAAKKECPIKDKSTLACQTQQWLYLESRLRCCVQNKESPLKCLFFCLTLKQMPHLPIKKFILLKSLFELFFTDLEAKQATFTNQNSLPGSAYLTMSGLPQLIGQHMLGQSQNQQAISLSLSLVSNSHYTLPG